MALDPDIYSEFDGNRQDIIDYYNRKMSRPAVNRLANISNTEIEGKNVEADIEDLLSSGALETLHEYNSELYGVGGSSIIEGIKKLDDSKLEELSDEQMEDQSYILVKLLEWGWKPRLGTIKTLNSITRKRSIRRNQIKGELRYDEFEKHIDEIEDIISESIRKANNKRRLKGDFLRLEVLEDGQVAVRLNIEQRGSSYRQFLFRTDGDGESDDEFSTKMHKYWPIKTRDVILDVFNQEYTHNIRNSPSDFIDPILGAFYEHAKDEGSVDFLDPLEHTEKDPKEIVDSRIEEQRELIEKTVDNPAQKDEYLDVLDNIAAVEQTALILENINVPGDPIVISAEMNSTIEEFIDKNDLEEAFDRFIEKSENIEYTLRIGDHEVEVTGDKISVPSGMKKAERDIIRGLLREDGVAI